MLIIQSQLIRIQIVSIWEKSGPMESRADLQRAMFAPKIGLV
jgi:hypothetical protein